MAARLIDFEETELAELTELLEDVRSTGGVKRVHQSEAGAHAWLPPAVWCYLSRLNVYEADATLSAKERLFHFWWLKRRLPLSRVMGLSGCVLQLPFVGFYVWYCVAYSPEPNIVYHMALFACAILSTFLLSIMLLPRWSVASFTAFTSFTMVIVSTLFVLAGFNDINNHRYSAPGAEPTPVLIPTEYDDTSDTLFLLGMFSMSCVALGIFPAWYRAAWKPFIVPLVYLVVAGAFPQPRERFLQVSMSRVLMLLQMATMCWWLIIDNWASERTQFDRLHALRAGLTPFRQLLKQLVPSSLVAEMLKRACGGSMRGGGRIDRFAERYDDASVMFAEVKIGDEFASPETRLRLLNAIFLCFDDLVARRRVVKVETISNVYMVAANVANIHNDDHVDALSRLALQFIEAVPKIESAFLMGGIVVRIGINSGPVIGGVIGNLLPRYRIFGDTVNTAARMETTSEPGRVHLSESAANILRQSPSADLRLVSRGPMAVKGKGVMCTYFLVGSDSSSFAGTPSMHVDSTECSSSSRWNIMRKFSSAHAVPSAPPPLVDEPTPSRALDAGTPDAFEADYTNERYARLWLLARVRGCYDPLAVLFVSLFLSYSTWDTAQHHLIEAAVLGTLLSASFLMMLVITLVGLIIGGRWRRMPQGLSWSFGQKLEMVPSLFNMVIFFEWTRIIRRTVSVPAVALSFEAAFSASCANVLDPLHTLALQVLIFGIIFAAMVYDGMTDPQHHNAPTVSGTATWLEVAVNMLVGFIFITLSCYVYNVNQDQMHRNDVRLQQRTLALRTATEDIVCNFLPAPVVSSMNKQSADGVVDIIAWSFDPACMLQSDIVGFTALGSRISPEELCGFLHDLFSKFDDIAQRLGVHKIETVGDAYIAGTGCMPVIGEDESTLHENATRIARFAQEIQRACSKAIAPDGSPVVMRIGLHCGPVVGGIVGCTMLRYHLFGSSMDVLSQLEQACDHGCVLLSDTFAAVLRSDDVSPTLHAPSPLTLAEALHAGRGRVRRNVTIQRLGMRRASVNDPLTHTPSATYLSATSTVPFELDPGSVLNLDGIGPISTFYMRPAPRLGDRQ